MHVPTKDLLRSPELRCGEVLAALASPPGLECATPAKLWPATPLLDGCRLSSPMTLAQPGRFKDPSCPEVLLLSPPGLDVAVAMAEPLRPPGVLMPPMLEEPFRPPGVLEGSSLGAPSVLPAPSHDKTGRGGGSKAGRQNAVAAAKPAERPKKKARGGQGQLGAPRPVGRQLPPRDEGKGTAPKSEGDGRLEQARSSHDMEATDVGNSQVPFIPSDGAACGLCEEMVPPPAQGTDVNHFFIDGRLICGPCRAIFDPDGFVPRYQVCFNPLCRRKWKQLTPKVLPHFCPPCKRQLEEGIGEAQYSLDTGPAEQMYQRWYGVFVELAEALGYPEPPPMLSAGSSTEPPPWSPQKRPADAEEARDRWRRLLEAFQQSFPLAPTSEDVRNWNSVHGRKLYYRGVIHRGHRQFICTVEALMELSEDLVTARRAPTGVREFHVLDWQEHLVDGLEVLFIAFPNPSVTERDRVSRIVRLLSTSGGEAIPPEPKQLQEAQPDLIPLKDEAESLSIEPVGPNDAVAAPQVSTVSSPLAQTLEVCEASGQTQSETTSRPPEPCGISPEEAHAEKDQKTLSDLASPCSAFADTAFADLMMWSEDQPGIEFDEQPGATRETSDDVGKLIAAGLEESGGREAPPLPPRAPSGNSSGQPRPRGPPQRASPSGSSPLVPRASPGASLSSPLLQPGRSPKVSQSSAPPGPPAAGKGRGKPSPQTPYATGTPMYVPANAVPGRSPMIVPRSPYASYFDD